MVGQVADQDARLDSDAGDISFLRRKIAQRDCAGGHQGLPVTTGSP
jgi:hypothetical protein